MEEYRKVSVYGEERTVEKGTTYEELAREYQRRFSSPILIAKSRNKFRELSSTIEIEDAIEFFDITDEDGRRVYTRSMSFLMIKAVKDILGKTTKVVIEHSINKNYYCEIRTPGITVDQSLLDRLKKRMKELVEENIPIVKEVFKREDAMALVKSFGMEDKVGIFRYRSNSSINLYRMDDFYDYFYGYMVPSTGYLEVFDLCLYEEGFLIQFPSNENPRRVETYEHLEKISAVFMEQLNWCRLMRVNNVAELNDTIVNGEFWDLVRVNEALHEKKIAQIADMIMERADKVKLVLIAGPTSSGKTTFAHRLCTQLRVNGIIPHVISLDDYFIDRDKTPIDEFGRHDYENINALDTRQFNEDLNRMIHGETVQLPQYNFLTGMREYKGNYQTLKAGEIFVVEGIHGLNEALTNEIAEECKFRIFISAMTQLNVDDHNRVSTTDSRLIRRIVRDYNFRGNDAASTIDMWPYVTRGEANNIFPFQENADVMFNSATIYELSVLKAYALPLLYKIDRFAPEYPAAKRLIKFLDYFLSVGIENLPNNSIIREFVGGSCFHV